MSIINGLNTGRFIRLNDYNAVPLVAFTGGPENVNRFKFRYCQNKFPLCKGVR